MRILSIDTATESATCAILEDNKVLGEITFNYKKEHSVILMPIIQSLLENIHADINSIDGLVVSKGPGSFTGLRIGIATVKGLSQGLKKPFIGISTLDSLAYNMSFSDGIICPILDALRGNVYTAFYKFEGDKLVKTTDYMVISIDELISILNEKNEKVCFVGDGTYKFKDIITASLKNSCFAPAHLNLTKASSLGELGLSLLSKGIEDDIYTFAPIYLRKSQAEREYDKKMEKLKNE